MNSPDHRDNPRRRPRQTWTGRGWYNQSADDTPRSGQRGWGGWSPDWRPAGWDTRSDRPQDAARDTGRDAVQDTGRDAGRDAEWDTSWNAAPDDGRDRVRGGAPGKKRVRIGDAERDRAVAQLSEHFVAGRLTQVEFEERSGQVTHARYSDDIEPLFDDLPTAAELQPAQPAAPVGVRRPGPPPPFLMIAPFLMIGLVVSSIALTAPWLLWGLFWIVLLSGMGRHHGHHHYRR